MRHRLWQSHAVRPGRPFAPEDEVVASQLALQAAVAADNQRLLASERERAALHGELEPRERLASHLRDVSQILDSEEAERRKIARQLHEGAAQDIAALLLELQILARDLDRELSRKQVEDVRSIARDTLVGLRQLALDLRPPSLDDHGLQAALEGIVEHEHATKSRQITLHYRCPCDLPPEVETTAYRLVDDAIRTSTGPLTVELETGEGGGTLRIEIRADEGSTDRELLGKLASARARIVLNGGTLRSNFDGTVAIIAELPWTVPRASEPR